jgi:hypothetical protein
MTGKKKKKKAKEEEPEEPLVGGRGNRLPFMRKWQRGRRRMEEICE